MTTALWNRVRDWWSSVAELLGALTTEDGLTVDKGHLVGAARPSTIWCCGARR
ncbi:hypothetical protein Ade02nite_47620 [Paractinoplanes deccanensis]|uniref:Uncharacterized protein n=1 Tax=Paractinoplanes deccanensis TaxID=113561 RepID=A0ABQ3Y7Z0_9ACTN|nr:hypothetical protein [Actinoplanes deccanensis]GID76121.1 hypothetical protein Ade02nite_47620 [Actinoplanes deccanensis]